MAQKSFYDSVLRLNIDGSYLFPERMTVVDLQAQQEELRYSSSAKLLGTIGDKLAPSLVSARFVFLGNGDFHHLTYMLIQQLQKHNQTPIHLVLIDNHPDNMIFLKGLHCGSWVHWVAQRDFVKKISIFGLRSDDLNGLNIFQNHYKYLRQGKIDYHCFKKPSPLLTYLSRGHAHDISNERENFATVFAKILKSVDLPVYLSIDKDVLDAREAWTNWDQGDMKISELLDAVKSTRDYFLAGDLCGEPSYYSFQNIPKKILRTLDGNPERRSFDPSRQNELNFQILDSLPL